MNEKDKYWEHHRAHRPGLSIGLFFILLGLALLIATNDMFHLGGIREYFNWETAMIFIGAVLLVNLHFTGGVLLIAGGFWFFMNSHYGDLPELIRKIYWPAVVIVLGIGFIISSLFKRNRIRN